MVAIKMVLDFILEKIHQKVKITKVLILSDNQSSVGLLTLGWEPTKHQNTTKDTLKQLEQVKRKDIEIEIKWTPGHAETRGNEEADILAKEASKEAESVSDENNCISLAEFKQAVKALGLSMWQRQWDVSEKGRFLYGLKPKVNKNQFLTFQTENNTVL